MNFDLKKFRKDFNLTQYDLQKILKVTQGFISRVENNKESFPDDYFGKLVFRFGEESINKYILTGEGSMLKNTPENTVSEPQATYGGDTASLMMRIRMLESEVEGLKRIIEAKDDQVKAKNELIEALRGMVEFKAAKPVHNIK